MTVKFQVGFTIDAETLFGLIAKFLPVENLAVEEVIERKPAPIPRIANAALKKQKPYPRTPRNRPATGGERFAGVRPLFGHGPVRLSDIRQAFRDQGFSANGLSSAVTQWLKGGLIERVGDEPGLYTLKTNP